MDLMIERHLRLQTQELLAEKNRMLQRAKRGGKHLESMFSTEDAMLLDLNSLQETPLDTAFMNTYFSEDSALAEWMGDFCVYDHDFKNQEEEDQDAQRDCDKEDK